jgi:hypothetical protein
MAISRILVLHRTSAEGPSNYSHRRCRGAGRPRDQPRQDAVLSQICRRPGVINELLSKDMPKLPIREFQQLNRALSVNGGIAATPIREAQETFLSTKRGSHDK